MIIITNDKNKFNSIIPEYYTRKHRNGQILSILLFDMTRKLEDRFNFALLIFSIFSKALKIENDKRSLMIELQSFECLLLCRQCRKNGSQKRCNYPDELKDQIMEQSIPKDSTVRGKNIFRCAITGNVNVRAKIVLVIRLEK